MDGTKVKAKSTPYYLLRRYWRSNPTNKKKLEKWVDENTNFGSVPVFLRAGGIDQHPNVISDLKVPNSW
jgi:hypothetical protein